MTRRRMVVGLVTITSLFLMATPVFSDTTAFQTTVTATLVTSDDSFGGCMAKVQAKIYRALPSCTPNWVTFSCTGDFTSEVRAWRMLDQAQLALATGAPVFLVVTDEQQHNGHCQALRIDVRAP